jgi:hypothetical protein
LAADGIDAQADNNKALAALATVIFRNMQNPLVAALIKIR